MLSNGTRNGPIPSGREYRHMSTGSLGINTNGEPGMLAPVVAPRIDNLARSPPSRQNTSHVPCKFFKSGNCQAGQACPFSHDLASTTDNVCKYFAKGNCKFGPKCANIHVLPNGLRVNYNRGSPVVGGGPLNLGGRVNPEPYHAQSSVLTNSLYRAQVNPTSPYSQQYTPFQTQEEAFSPLTTRQPEISVPAIDTTYASGPQETFGSPREEDSSRLGLGLSPANTNGLSVLDAPLPASFDSNGISQYARLGPMASSVPAKFGIETPPGSVGANRDGKGSETLRNLHTSAFGEDTRDRFNAVAASSPPAEEYFGKRAMHSQRLPKSKNLSNSLPKAVDQDWESSFTFEEDYLPGNLTDLMTPQEKARRGSRTAEDERPLSYSGTGTPNNETTSKFGSPSNASPSRWSAYFQQRKEEEDKASRASAFGHVGSPLRSSLHPGAIPPAGARPLRRAHTSDEMSPYLASPPRQSSMSIISQQLQRTRLGRAESSGSDPGLLSTSAATARAASSPIGAGRASLMVVRTLSTSSNASGRFTTPIEEAEQEHGSAQGEGDFVFSMEEDGDVNKEKRSSGGANGNGKEWTYPRSPRLAPIGGGRSMGTSLGSSVGSRGKSPVSKEIMSSQ